MKASLSKRFLCAVLIAGGGTIVYAANERPRDTGVACARAANAYCKVQDPATRSIPHGASPDARATD
ncbi:hypothetical protein [Cupriavidus necator]|uniref:hypothetical protein n=1 Tax=Cupriavidus necator TaxID=106590 RepID=UPI0005B4B2FD|nr:hypothetical protein [Cupriavidus necator]